MKEEVLPETLEFLYLSPPDMTEFNTCINDVKGLQELFRARACHLVHKASQVMMIDPSKVNENFGNYQQFDLRDMCQAYFDTYIIDTYMNWLDTISDSNTRAVFEKILLLHLQNKIINNEVYFLSILGDEKIENAKRSVMKLLKELRKDILPLTDVLPIPNRGLGPLGNEDLQVYDRMIQHFKSSPKVSEKPTWWKLTYTNSQKA